MPRLSQIDGWPLRFEAMGLHLGENKAGTWPIVVFVAAGFALLAGLLGLINAGFEPSVLLMVTTALSVVTIAFLRYKSAGGAAVFSPLCGPLLYITYALIAPQAYMLATGNGIGSIPRSSLTAPTMLIMSLLVIGYILGTRLTAILSMRSSGQAPEETSVDYPSLRTVGRCLLMLSLAAKVYQLRSTGSVFTTTYGAGQTEYTSGTAIAILGESLVAVGALLIMHANSRQFGKPLQRLDWLLLGAVLLISVVLLGSRGEAIAPVFLFLWFRTRFGKQIKTKTMVVMLGAVATAFLGIWKIRSSAAAAYPLVQQLLWQTASPQLLTANVAAVVPDRLAFFEGSTYLSALQGSLPGFISRSIFGDPSGTGALAYREIIGLNDPNQGYGFAFPTEAYLNFGYVGVFIAGLLLGVLIQWAWNWQTTGTIMNRLAVFVYPLLISYLPYGLRSDSLGQIKSIIYPLAILGIALIWSRTVAASRAPKKRHLTPA